MVSEGDVAPDFTRTDGDGQTITLSSLRGSNVVLYFSNGAGPGCTSQSCSFRDAAEDFADLDAKILAISAQSNASAADFKRTNRLPFPVIPDNDRQLQKMYGVPSTLGLIPGRVTYVIDKEGVIKKIYNSQFSTAQHITVAKQTLASL